VKARNALALCRVKWKKSIKKMRDKKCTGDNNVPEDVLKMLGKAGLKIMTQLINNRGETGQWSKGFHRSYNDSLKKKKLKATKRNDHRTINSLDLGEAKGKGKQYQNELWKELMNSVLAS
jgi:hypothetical protein